MTSVEQLYKDFGVLADAKDKAGEHSSEYISILSGVNGGANEKRLASQFIVRFFKYFPDLHEKAIDAQLDLCEDEDVAIRKQAIRDLSTLCKENREHVPRIADVLTQLLQSEDHGELMLVNSSLMSLFKIDAKGTLGGIFSQILNGEDVVREKAVKFLASKFKQLPESVWTKDVEEYILTECKKVLVDVTGDEFIAFVQILSQLKCCCTVQGRQQLVEIVVEQAGLDEEFVPTEQDCVDRLIQCIKQALPFFSKNVHSTKFVQYVCEKVLPVLPDISTQEEEVDTKLEILKLLAEMATTSGELQDLPNVVKNLYDRLLSYMPLPPADEDGENNQPSDEPQLHFSYVECLMYTFHQVARKHTDYLVAEENTERLKDFRIRLQYFARGIQGYIKQLRQALQGKTGDSLKTDENKLKVVALKITNNINVLIKDLFHNPPAYKSMISLSWKPVQKAPTTSPGAAGQKRSSSTSEDSGAAKKPVPHSARKLYAPPSGKFSEKAGTYNPGQRGGRGFRGGRGRSWRGKRW